MESYPDGGTRSKCHQWLSGQVRLFGRTPKVFSDAPILLISSMLGVRVGENTHELSDIDIILGANTEVGSFAKEPPASDGVGIP